MNIVSWTDLTSASQDCGILPTIDLQMNASSTKRICHRTRYLVKTYVNEQSVACYSHIPDHVADICALFYSTPPPNEDADETELRKNLEIWKNGMQSEYAPSQSLSVSNICTLLQFLEFDDERMIQRMLQNGISEQIMGLIKKLALQRYERKDFMIAHQCLIIYKAIMPHLSESSNVKMVSFFFSLVRTWKSRLIIKQAIEILLFIMEESSNLKTAQHIEAQILAQLPSIVEFTEEETSFGSAAHEITKDKFIAFLNYVFESLIVKQRISQNGIWSNFMLTEQIKGPIDHYVSNGISIEYAQSYQHEMLKLFNPELRF